MDDAAYGQMIHDLNDFLLITGKKFLQEEAVGCGGFLSGVSSEQNGAVELLGTLGGRSRDWKRPD